MEEEDEFEITTIDTEDASFYISKGGPLSVSSNDFEERKSQIELLKNIANAFNKNQLGVFEAGTGVGKSYAYLIPAMLWAIQNRERVVISTGTINLQSQIFQKDIPSVEKIIGKKVKSILMKGRQNYICKRRLQDTLHMPDLFENETEPLKQIGEWAKNSASGDKSELAVLPSESVWSKVCSESDACMGGKCPFFEECFVMKVRKEASDSSIIVVNHHLLFADIEARMNGGGYEGAVVLPPYKRIVFDEAHGIESAATSFFSENVSRFKISKLINQLYRKRKTSEAGHLINLSIISANEDKTSLAYEVTERIRNDISTLEIAAGDLLENDYSIRLCDATARNFGPVLNCLSELSKSLGEFTNIVNLVMEGVAEEDRDTPSYWETRMILRRLEGHLKLIRDFSVWDEKKNNVFWIQKKRLPFDMAKDGNSVYQSFISTPLDIAPLMNEGVFEPMSSVICTSATLRTGNSFSYWMARTGISFSETERVKTAQFDSPFPYSKNMLFAVPRDAPMSDQMEFQQFVEMALTKLILAAEGRTLILFTSYESLRSAFNTVSLQLKGFSGRLMKQGDDDNARLLYTFREESDSVLFATDSFWQGVDVPGESLSQVIIVKLPFSVPNDPVFTARSEAIERRGGNSFMELSVPEAVIKFRQGVGRLIRKCDDRGVVVCLDKRIYEKRYGSIFISSLPECKKTYDNFSETLTSIKKFLDV